MNDEDKIKMDETMTTNLCYAHSPDWVKTILYNGFSHCANKVSPKVGKTPLEYHKALRKEIEESVLYEITELKEKYLNDNEEIIKLLEQVSKEVK